MKRTITLVFFTITVLFVSARFVPADKNPIIIFNGKTLHSGDAVQKEDLYKLLNAHLQTNTNVCPENNKSTSFHCLVTLMDSWGTLKFNSTLPSSNIDKFREALAKMNTGDKVYLNEITYCKNTMHMPARFVFTLL